MNIVLNGRPQEIEDGSTIFDVLHSLNVADEQIAVEVNRELIPRAQHSTHVVRERDAIEVVRFVGGG